MITTPGTAATCKNCRYRIRRAPDQGGPEWVHSRTGRAACPGERFLPIAEPDTQAPAEQLRLFELPTRADTARRRAGSAR